MDGYTLPVVINWGSCASPTKTLHARAPVLAPMASRASLRCLQAATALVFAYLCVGELLPAPAWKVVPQRILQHYQRQQVILLALLSCLAVLAGKDVHSPLT